MVTRLRPIVHASPTPTGVHVRGWASSFTVSGGPGAWRLWQAMARPLAEGVPAGQLGPPRGSPAVVAAAELILAQLREHDMLVEVPPEWGAPSSGDDRPPPDLAGWLESVAADPAAAWRRLRGAPATVRGDGPVARASRRALAGSGLAVTPAPGHPDGTLLTSGTEVAVFAGCQGEVGYVVPVGPPERVRAVAAAVAARLGLADPGADVDADPTGADGSPYPLAALVGGAAAHRLVCAVAGLPDPAVAAATLAAGAARRPPLAYPEVLVARLDPLRATYHPWLPAAPPVPAAEPGLDAVLARLAALGDPELGLVPAPEPGDLPQLPAALALAGGALGVGTTTDAARVQAAVAAAERTLYGLGLPAVVGVSAGHATGVALRRRVHAALPELATTAVAEAEWAGAVPARRWWKSLTLRFGLAAEPRVRRLAPGAVHAEVVVAGASLAWAVEASPADAVACAGLAATGIVQARRAGVAVEDGAVTVTGAAPAWLPEPVDAAPWTGPDWYWPAGLADAEPALQATLRGLLPARLAPLPPSAAPDLLRSLDAAGFVALTGRRP